MGSKTRKSHPTKTNGRDPNLGIYLGYSTTQLSPDYNRLSDVMKSDEQPKGFAIWPRFTIWQAEKGYRTRRYLLLGAFYEKMKAEERYSKGEVLLTSEFSAISAAFRLTFLAHRLINMNLEFGGLVPITSNVEIEAPTGKHHYKQQTHFIHNVGAGSSIWLGRHWQLEFLANIQFDTSTVSRILIMLGSNYAI